MSNLDYAFLSFILEKRPTFRKLSNLKKEIIIKDKEVQDVVDYLTYVLASKWEEELIPKKDTLIELLEQAGEIELSKWLYVNFHLYYDWTNYGSDMADFVLAFSERDYKDKYNKLKKEVSEGIDRDDKDVEDKVTKLYRLFDSKKHKSIAPTPVSSLVDKDRLFRGETMYPTHIPDLNEALGGDRSKGGIAAGEITIIGGYTNAGKGIPLDTEIPTPSGFKMAKDLIPGEYIFDQNGEPTKIVWISGIHNRDCYKLTFSDNSSIVTDDQHLWEVEELGLGNTRTKKVISSKDILDKTIWTNYNNKRSRFRIPITAPVKYSKKELPLDPYYLGVWLGDGSSNEAAITVAINNIELIDNLKNIYSSELNIRDFVHNNCYTVSFSKRKNEKRYRNNNTKSKLRDLNLLNNKHIPSVYLTSSIEDRIQLVRGLMDTDGCAERNGPTFYNSNERLIDEFVSLLRSLGVNCQKRPKRTKCNGKMFNSFSVNFTAPFSVFNTKIKKDKEKIKAYIGTRRYRYIHNIEKVDSVPTICFKVDSERELFLATKDYIVTHNSLCSQSLFAHYLTLGIPTVYFNIEVRQDLFISQLFSQITGEWLYQNKSSQFLNPAWELYENFLRSKEDRFVLYNQDGPRSVTQLETEIEKYASDGYEIFFLDTINSLMGHGERKDLFTEVMITLESLAKRYNIAIVATAQMKQSLMFGDDKRPNLWDIGEGVAIQQKAGTVIGIYRSDKFGESTAQGIMGQCDYTSFMMLKLRNRSAEHGEFVRVSYDNTYKMYTPYTGMVSKLAETDEEIVSQLGLEL